MLAAATAALWAVLGGAPEVLSRGGLPAQALGFVTLVVPVGLYLCASESSPARATWGKRRLGLQVETLDGSRPSRGAVAVRTAVKLLPWEVGHTVVHQFVRYERVLGVPAPRWVLALAVVANALPLVWVATVLLTPSRRGPHDRASGTRVVVADRA